MLSAYQQRLRERFLAVPEIPAPAPWRRVLDRRTPVGGLQGIGFGAAPDDGRDLVLVFSGSGLGVFDATTGEKLARDRDAEDAMPESAPDLSCEGIGPLAGTRVRMAGWFGGGLHTGTDDGWGVEVVSPEWPHHRVLLSRGSGMPHDGPHGERWWHIHDASSCELRAAGFSPSGRTLAVATSSDLTLWTRPAVPPADGGP
ncbi:hypothetical protein [Streptomyces sp. enrichment culture]|uniref:hypothetical protein n=1 Tax=Streptomyces sp. enrichment culture TaxID=1795815 RepID=UPI003F557F2F